MLQEWCPSLQNKKILVTDLFNEAFERKELPGNFWNFNVDIIGVDISKCVVEKFNKKYPTHKKLVCDIRNLPFKDSEK